MKYYIQDAERECNVHVHNINDVGTLSITFDLRCLSDPSCAFSSKEEAEETLRKIKEHHTDWMRFVDGLQVVES